MPGSRVGVFAALLGGLIIVSMLAGCGGSSSVDSDGFTAKDRRAARNALSVLAGTSVYDAAREISLTQAHVPNVCVVHIQRTNPMTFRMFLTWVPNAEALGGAPGSRSQRAYAWLDAVISTDGLKGDYAFHQGNERTQRTLRSHYGDVFAKPVAKCLVLENQQFGLLPAGGA